MTTARTAGRFAVSARNFGSGRAVVGTTVRFLLLAGLTAARALGITGSTAADRVLGQADFIHNAPNTIDPASMNAGDYLAVDLSVNPNRIYVADEGNSRVLGYKDVTALANGGPADLVIGQPDFFSAANKGGVSGNSLSDPVGVVLDSGGHLYVSDFNNHRVLEYDTPLSNTTANRVFGQLGGFNTNLCNIEGAPSARSLCTPDETAVDGTGKLIVADLSNNRVLVYNTPLTSDTANLVFGQGGVFNTNQCNKGGISADSLCNPDGVGSSNEGFYIVDRSNNRVLKYPSGSTTATVVLVQFDFVHNARNTIDPSALSNPFTAAIDASATPNHLYVADTFNSRVLGYLNAASFLSGQNADLVIGQPDFFAGNCNNGGLNASRLCNPVGLLVDGAGNLLIADSSNSRALFYPNPFAGCGGVSPCVGGPATAVWGQLGMFTTNPCNNGGPTPTANSLCRPEGIGLDHNGNVYIADFKDTAC